MEASQQKQEVVTEYHCSACSAIVTSRGTEAMDHMQSEHGVDPELGPQDDAPYLIPVESNPTLDDNGVPV